MTKYKAKKVEVNGIKFDSKLESQYYLHLLTLKKAGEIKDFSLQPTFTLQDKFKKDGKTIRAIVYKADFQIVHTDDSFEIVDVKGYETTDFKLKKKMFMFKYPNLKLTIITYRKKYGWVTLEELKELSK